ncbi:MAG: YvcK family protein [Blastocatellia bacterium]|nr:YvcK family protein [Blastocatellia bacterium]
MILTWIAGKTAIVAVSDDGGSSGRLRDELQMLPPGDIRNCMVALSEDSLLLSKLFKHRFRGDGQLGGHSFGNLFLAALTEITGDFPKPSKFLRRF